MTLRRIAFAAAPICLGLTAGCGLIAGLNDFDDDPSPTGGTGGMGGTGANGGGANGGIGGDGATGASGGAMGVPAISWTTKLDAVYFFEVPPPNLGSGDVGPNLNPMMSGPAQDSDAQQGEWSAVFDPDNRLTGPQQTSVFDSTSSVQGITFGGWFKTTMESVVMGKVDDGAVVTGYQLDLLSGRAAACTFGDSNFEGTAKSSNDAWVDGEWVHVVCRWTGAGDGEVVAILDGQQNVTEPGSLNQIANANAPFVLSAEGTYRGLMDEVFFVKKALPAESIRRIYACGIDGTGCECGPTDNEYLHCGRLDPNCAALPPCRQETPTPNDT